MDIEWILEAAISVTKLNGNYVVQELNGDSRQCVISFSADGTRMLFDGIDIETEDFMAYLGLIEQVDNDPTGMVQCEAGE